MKKLLLSFLFFTSLGMIAQAQNCQAMFVFDDSNCPSVSFYDTSYAGGPTSQVVFWQYDFGDGNTSTSPNPTNTYTSNGTYLVCLTIATSTGCASTFCDSVTIDCIGGSPCTAAYQFYPDSFCNYSFIDYSTGGSGNVVGWYWSFGDGGSSTQQNPNYQYASNGQYLVCLTIQTDNGCSDTICDSVDVFCATAGLNDQSFDGFSFGPNPAYNELTVSIDDGEITSYQIVNLSGQIKLIGEISNDSQTIDVSTLTKGIYLLKLENNGRHAIRKFAKQ